MKLTLEPTSRIVKIEGRPCRIWSGHDAHGTPVLAHIRCVSPQTHDERKLADFEAELDALPSLGPGAIDYRFLVD